MDESMIVVDRWAAIAGRWQFTPNKVVYMGPSEGQSTQLPLGLALGKAQLRSGKISGTVSLGENAQECNGRFVIGYSSGTRGYFSAGIGGYGCAYVLDEFVEQRGWRALAAAGTKDNLLPNSRFAIEAQVHGQRVSLKVDGIQVIAHTLPRPLDGDQVGLLTWGPGPVEFTDVVATARKPEVFVVMQFGEPYDSLYAEVIKEVVDKLNLKAYRADEVYKPGIILQDIIGGIVEAEVIIAEITPPNQNVFYELGYAHALSKPTILLADRSKELPFDIKGYRCIFYEDTIRGKRDLESNLRRHLLSILDEP